MLEKEITWGTRCAIHNRRLRGSVFFFYASSCTPTQTHFTSLLNPHISAQLHTCLHVQHTQYSNTHHVCMYFKHPELRSYLDAGVEIEDKEAKFGMCSVKSSHLCRCRGLCVGSGASKLTIAQYT